MILAAVTIAGCSKAEPAEKSDPTVAPPPPQPEVSVVLSGVTLADDCADGQPTKPTRPPAKTAAKPAAEPEPPAAPAAAMAMPSAGACADPKNCHGPTYHQPPCEQTAMQLSWSSIGAPPTSLKIKRVELLDASGKVIDTLTARAPTRWDDKTSTYVPWDETIGQPSLATSYKLGSPDWNKISNGRWNAHSMRFMLRVTVTIGNAERTIEKQSITPAMIEPAVAT
jgi:hypothetical protein